MNEIPMWYLVLLDRINALRNSRTEDQLNWNLPDAYGYTSALVMTRTITHQQRTMIDEFIDNANRRAWKSLQEATT